MALVHGNEPTILPNGMAIETSITDSLRLRSKIPIVQVLCGVLPGQIDNPRVIFESCLEMAYAAALNNVHKQPHPAEDTVYITISHHELLKNGGHWGTFAYQVDVCLDHFVRAWEEAMQSGDPVDLANGAFEMVCTFTFSTPIDVPPRAMGARPTYPERKKSMFIRQIHDDFYVYTVSLKYTPFTQENLCFPMSFMCSHLRHLIFQNNKSVEVRES